jgi:hypothetical protein
MISYAFIDGFTRSPRNVAIERIKHAVALADGVIVDFAFFGAEALRLTIELDAGQLETLREELEAHGDLELFSRCRAELQEARTMTRSHPIVAMLHLTTLAPLLESVVAAG